MAGKVVGSVLAGLVALGGLQGVGAESRFRPGASSMCGNATLRGTYGIQMQGARTLPDGTFETLIGVVVRTYDGLGNFSQVDNIKGSVTGMVPDREGFGTYQVNADCSGITRFEPGPGILIEERLVIVERGNEVRTMTSFPPPLMVTSVQKRIDRH